MKLIKQLLSQQPLTQVEESFPNNDAKIRAFKRSFNNIEDALEKLDLYLADQSAFTQHVKVLGGDEAYLRDAKQQLNDLQQTLSELHMSVGIASGDSWEHN